MKFPSHYSWPKACIACGQTGKYQKLYLTSYMNRPDSRHIETLEVPVEICDRCYIATKTEIDEVKPSRIHRSKSLVRRRNLAFILVSIMSITIGLSSASFILWMLFQYLGMLIVYETYLHLQDPEPIRRTAISDLENPIRLHLNVLRIKPSLLVGVRRNVLVFVFRDSTFLYMFNRANQSLLAKREIYSILYDQPYAIKSKEIKKLIYRQHNPEKIDDYPKKQTTTTKQDSEYTIVKNETKCPFCGTSANYPPPVGGVYDLVSCKNCGERFIPQ